MALELFEETIFNDIISTCKRLFGLDVIGVTPIKRGWLNLKWKVTTNQGTFLIKQYNKDRYKLYKHDQLILALNTQVRLHQEGFPCPKLYPHEGNILLETDSGERFLVMDYCEGENIPPGHLNTDQMHELGRVSGLMHQKLNDGSLKVMERPEFIPPSTKERLDHWLSVYEIAKQVDKSDIVPIIEQQIKITKTVNFDDFKLHEPGWAHRDLWVDNLLFVGNKLSSVLDFDRMKYDYPQLDVARAVISGALNNNHFDVELAKAFVEGYREFWPFEKGSLTSALKLLWYMESTWWIDFNMDELSGPPARFAEEMMWLSENYHLLESMFGEL